MVFVPLPLFATLILLLALVRFVTSRDMARRPHQLFALLITLYGVQSLLTSLRWGYGFDGVTVLMAILAPVLPALVLLAYKSLADRQSGFQLWPLTIVGLNWLAFALLSSLADPLILLTYLGFGVLLLRFYWRGEDHLTLSALNDASEILTAMGLTGLALVASAFMDAYIIYDFVTNDGRNAGLVLTIAQTSVVLIIGISAVFGRVPDRSETDAQAPQPSERDVTEADADIMARLEALFERDRLHLNDDLSVRRLSRRLGVPDRQVSNAVNRTQEMSVSQFVNAHRVTEACRLLRDTDETILQVSLAAGFATKSNFNREFSRVTGQTPSQWRASHKVK